jgi:hypothetical protein
MALWLMRKNEPMLRINIPSRGNPRCSACGEEFGGEGLARDLIAAFALHVRRQHVRQRPSYSAARMVRELPSKGKLRMRRLLSNR